MWLIKPLTHCSGFNWGSSIHMDLAPVNSMQVANMQNLSATTRNRPKARFFKKNNSVNLGTQRWFGPLRSKIVSYFKNWFCCCFGLEEISFFNILFHKCFTTLAAGVGSQIWQNSKLLSGKWQIEFLEYFLMINGAAAVATSSEEEVGRY